MKNTETHIDPASSQISNILFIDFPSRGAMHAAFNASFLGALHLAFPNAQITVCAHQPHNEALEQEASHIPNLQFIERPALYEGERTRPLYNSNLQHFFGLTKGALKARKTIAHAVKRTRADLVITIAPPPFIIAAMRFASIPRQTLVHHVLFHQLKTAKQDNRRNPLWKVFSFKNEVRVNNADTVSFVLLEDYIKASFDDFFADIKPNSFLLPHPIAKPATFSSKPSISAPVKVGFVGQARAEKGFAEFLQMADALASPDIEFHVIGHLHDAEHSFDFSSLKTAPTAAKVPQSEFANALANVDCIVQPLSPAYGEYSSGTILDAVAYEKPLFCFENKIMRSQTDKGQPIGFLGETLEELMEAVRAFAAGQNQHETDIWRKNMRLLNEQRSSPSLARIYRDYVSSQLG